MGIGVSNWRLAKAVSILGQMGVVSGAALDSVFVRRLQLGDPGGNLRRALSKFPWPEMVQRVMDTYFIPGGKLPDKPFRLIPMPRLKMKRAYIELVIIANFVEVFLAKEGHTGLIGINYLEKTQLQTLPSLLGSMLAGVNFILVGAGIPIGIPGAMDGLSRWTPVELNIRVEENHQHHKFTHRFDPREYCTEPLPELRRPKFLPIVSSDIVAKSLMRKATGEVDGFIIENHTAGGHNAPPRKTVKADSGPQSMYGPRDIPDLAKIKSLERPFWIAGGFASPGMLREALEAGADGIQIGTAFAFCEESGIIPEIKQEVLRRFFNGQLEISTDVNASPTGYPFKVLRLTDSVDNRNGTGARKRVCDMGYLRQFYFDGVSDIGYRCPAEPSESFVKKGGGRQETLEKQCLCNGLMATVGLGQPRAEGCEPPLVTSGEDFSFLPHLMKKDDTAYTAKDVVDYLTAGIEPRLMDRQAVQTETV